MNGTHRDIFLRAHTAKVREDDKKSHAKSEKSHAQLDRWPERCLIFDTEVRTDIHQRLMFGIYRICKLVNDPYLCEREGIFFSGETEQGPLGYSAVLEKEELNAIGRFADNIPDVEIKGFPPRIKLEVHQTFTAFIEKVFWHAVRKGWLIVCFNSAFDLSRLSRDWRDFRKGGFSLIMGHRFWRKTQIWIPDPYRPVIHIEPKNARVAFITRGRPKIASKKNTRQKWDWSADGRFLDAGTLLLSLFDRHMGLDAWCEHFKIPGKLKEPDGKPYEPSGRVTAKELAYCRNVAAHQKTRFLVTRRFESESSASSPKRSGGSLVS